MLGLLFLGALGISGAKEVMRRLESKGRKRYLPNGIPYYMHNGSFYLYDTDEKFVWFCSDDKAEIIKGRRRGTIIYDGGAELREKMMMAEAEGRRKAIELQKKYGKNYYINRMTSMDVHIEIDTDKMIAKIERKKLPNGKYECRKWYWYNKYKGMGYQMEQRGRGDIFSVAPDDEGIVITEEEFESLCSYGDYRIDDDWYGNRYCRDDKVSREEKEREAGRLYYESLFKYH
jgi:hypothetical protein